MFTMILYFRIDSLKYFSFEREDNSEINYSLSNQVNKRLNKLDKLFNNKFAIDYDDCVSQIHDIEDKYNKWLKNLD